MRQACLLGSGWISRAVGLPAGIRLDLTCGRVLDFLTSDSAEACILRERFVFYVIPMMNPDGVVLGNYRCLGK